MARIQEELAKKFSQHVQDLQRRMENVENENRKKDQELQKLRDELAKERQEKEKARKEADVARNTIDQLKTQRDAPQANGSSTAKAGAQAKAAPATAKALPAKPFATKAAPKTIQKKPGKYADHPTSAPPAKTLDIHEQAAQNAGCFFSPEERESSAESASQSVSDYECEEPAKNSRPRSNSDEDENNVGGKRAAMLGSELPGSQCAPCSLGGWPQRGVAVASWNTGKALRHKICSLLESLEKRGVHVVLVQDTGIMTRSDLMQVAGILSSKGFAITSKSYDADATAGYTQEELTWLHNDLLRPARQRRWDAKYRCIAKMQPGRHLQKQHEGHGGTIGAATVATPTCTFAHKYGCRGTGERLRPTGHGSRDRRRARRAAHQHHRIVRSPA